jgi:hypothetical protein
MKRLFMLVFVLLVAGARAEVVRSVDKDSLRGLSGVYVLSQILDTAPEGFTTNGIFQAVRTQLRDGGIMVYAEPKQSEGSANLCVTLDAVKDPQLGIYLFSVQVVLGQTARLTRMPNSEPVVSQTWVRTIQGLASPDRTSVITDAIRQTVDLFIKEFRAVNPKTETPKK